MNSIWPFTLFYFSDLELSLSLNLTLTTLVSISEDSTCLSSEQDIKSKIKDDK